MLFVELVLALLLKYFNKKRPLLQAIFNLF